MKARRTVTFETPATFSALDEFTQSTGPLAGKTAFAGGMWAGAGDADDFQVATGATAQRTATSDSNDYTGRYAISGVAAMAGQAVQVDVKVNTFAVGQELVLRMGVLSRYIDLNNWFRATVVVSDPNSLGAPGPRVELYKRVAGSLSVVSYTDVAFTPNAFHTLRLVVEARGHWAVWFGRTGTTPTLVARGVDADLATGGALASGKPGFYDAYANNLAATRNYDNFVAFTPTADAAIFAGRSLEFRSYGDDPALREDPNGYWGRPGEVRGGRMWLPPAGDENKVSRIAVMARRNDIETQGNDSVTDPISVTVSYRPRWINVPRQP